MSPDESLRPLLDLLDLAEDYYRDGFRRDRGAALGEAPDAPPAGVLLPETLETLAREVSACTLCALGGQRRKAVPGEGVAAPAVLVVGEGPGAEEDATGRPFVGAAGKYLDKWLAAIGLDRRANCFIANVVKCRPPANRDPLPDEIQACSRYLARQIEMLKPRAILALGRFAAQRLTGATEGIGALRSRVHEHRGIPIVATYHPSAVLRDPALRAPVWDDLKRLKALVGNA